MNFKISEIKKELADLKEYNKLLIKKKRELEKSKKLENELLTLQQCLTLQQSDESSIVTEYTDLSDTINDEVSSKIDDEVSSKIDDELNKETDNNNIVFSNKKQTKEIRERAIKIMSEILTKHNLNFYDVEKIYCIMKEKYADNTIINYIKYGILSNTEIFKNQESQNTNEYKKIQVFLRNLKDKKIRERIDNDKKEVYKSLESVEPDIGDEKIINLYKLLPLRVSEFVRLKYVTVENDNTDFNYIVLDSNKLILHNTKSIVYDEVKLLPNVMDYVKNNFVIDSLIYDKTERTLQRTLKKYNITSQMLRKMYANDEKDTIMASRILNHKYSTHVSVYKNQADN
jgi:hypothetical protein